MKKLLIGLIIFTALYKAPIVLAQETTCVNSYGQGVVCGARTPEEIPVVDTGIADVSLKMLGVGLLISSVVLYKKALLKGTR
jgi:hypothetical protein